MEPSTSSSNGGGTSELFICFTSRISSMKKLTSSNSGNSKSLLSPARSSQISLSSSLSRRLRSSGSLRGGASPMFPAGKKRSGTAAFENPEPSSPKVTCIGQVRVKSKAKKKNQSNNAAVARCRRSLSGEASFRRSEREKTSGRRWVTMCDALRLSCLVPSCRSSKKREEEGRSCGAVLARWLVADGKGGRREIELVMAAEDRSEKMTTNKREQQQEQEEEERDREAAVVVVERSGSLKRRVLEGIEFREFAGDRDDGDQKARVSLCVPPKNALLLMRCRSDPVKMAALASRFYDCDDDGDDEIINQSSNNNNNVQDDEEEYSEVEEEPDLVKEEPTNMLVVEEEEEALVLVKEEEKGENETEKIDEEEEEEMVDEMQAVVIVDEFSTDQPNAILEEDSEEEEENMFRLLYEEEEEDEMEVIEAEAVNEDGESERDDPEEHSTAAPEKEKERERESGGLPDCLLLMMCEPKLSMEVSKETWIRTTDFVRWLPERRRNNIKKPVTKAALPPKPPATVLLQPPRSSCSAVTGAGAGAKPYDPFLTRCKSEPRKSPVTVQPLEPFWKNKKHDSGHHRASAGVGV